jgi:pyruvate kinase
VEEPVGLVKTKIVATVGPACRSPEMLRRLVAAGVDVFRLNFSHGSHEEHTENLSALRDAAAAHDRIVAVLQDLCGPKIRLGALVGDAIDCSLGERFWLSAEAAGVDRQVFSCSQPEIIEDLAVGDQLLFADGLVAMRVISASPHRAELEVTLPGRLRSRQGINLPGVELNIASLTPKDLLDLDWTATHDVDYVGLSFVRSASDLERLRAELDKRGSRARIVAKIEKPQAVARFEEILAATDAVMVARGDLGVELDVAHVPSVQKRIISACHRARVPVITATQMLNSMEISSRPTRAEASDVYNAVLDGSDAVMLSGETAIGDFPVEAVAMMSRIVSEAESSMVNGRPDPGPLTRHDWITDITASMVQAAALVCRTLPARLLIVATHSGRSALALSKQPNQTSTLAITDDPAVARAMALYWGVTPLVDSDLASNRSAIDHAIEWARARHLVATGDHVVLQVGLVPDSPVHNAIIVRTVS